MAVEAARAPRPGNSKGSSRARNVSRKKPPSGCGRRSSARISATALGATPATRLKPPDQDRHVHLGEALRFELSQAVADDAGERQRLRADHVGGEPEILVQVLNRELG